MMKYVVPCRGVFHPIGTADRGAICREGSNHKYRSAWRRFPVRTVRGVAYASLSNPSETVGGGRGATDLANTISHEQNRIGLQASQEIFVPPPAQPSQTTSALQGAVIGFAVAASVFGLGKRRRRRRKSPEKVGQNVFLPTCRRNSDMATGEDHSLFSAARLALQAPPRVSTLESVEETEQEPSLISSLATDLDISGTERLREMQKVTAMTRSLARSSLKRPSDHDAKPERTVDLSTTSKPMPASEPTSTSTQKPADVVGSTAAAPHSTNKQKKNRPTVLEEATKDSEDEFESKSYSLPRLKSDDCEPVDWVNMWIRKVWMIYQKGLERWIMNTLQPPIDYIGKPAYIKRVLIKEIILGNNPIVFSNMRRASSRQVENLRVERCSIITVTISGPRVLTELLFLMWIALAGE